MNLKEFTYRVFPIKNQLFRFAMRLVNNVAEAEDVVQEVFIKIWHKRDDLNEVKNIEAWSMRLTRNLSIDKLRSKHQKVQHLADGLDFVSQQATPYQALATQDSLTYIQQLMQALPEKQRAVMHLRDMEEMSYQEIADVLNISLDQVRTNLFRARQKMKQLLIKTDVYES